VRPEAQPRYSTTVSGKDLEHTQELPATPPVEGASPSLRAEQIPAGNRVGAYVIRSRIDSGGGGTVYVAESADGSGRRVAVKVLLRELAGSALALSRFQREAEVVRLINHPNITRVVESGELPDGRPYIVMELVSTEDLKDMLSRRGRLSPAELLEILEPVCSALSAAHAAGVVHRDLKASNISVGHEDGKLVIKLLDFGIARFVQPDGSTAGLTVMGTRLGTPHAMSPEQVRGEPVDSRADIYALGVLIYQALTGAYPFLGTTPQELERLHLVAAPPRPSRTAPVSPAMDAVVLRCLEKAPAARYQSIDELLAALRVAVAGEPREIDDERTCQAVAVRVEVAEDGALDEEEQADVMDDAEQALHAAGYQLPLQTANLLLAVLPVSGDPRRAARQALELAGGLARDLSLTVALHAGAISVRGPEHAPRITGGDLLRATDWALVAERAGVRLSREAAAALD
jgi:eukaryotic-like serine/threonine-protein kinase